MLARSSMTLPTETALPGGSVYEPKWDGYRVLLFTSADRIRVRSRRGADLTSRFPEVAQAAAEQLPPGLVLDGKLVVWADGRLDFGALQRGLELAETRLVLSPDSEQPASWRSTFWWSRGQIFESALSTFVGACSRQPCPGRAHRSR